jgi:hypothetical protein
MRNSRAPMVGQYLALSLAYVPQASAGLLPPPWQDQRRWLPSGSPAASLAPSTWVHSCQRCGLSGCE